MLPAKGEHCFSRVVTNDASVAGLGIWNTSRCEPVPNHADELLGRLEDNERVLVTLDELDVPAAYEDFGQWNEVLERYERDWFEPMLKALTGRRLSSLELIPVSGQRFCMSPVAPLKFWKRSKSYREVLLAG